MTVKILRSEVTEWTRKHSESELVGPKLAELLDALHARLAVEESNTYTRECKTFQGEESRRSATAEQVKRGISLGSVYTTAGPEFKFNRFEIYPRDRSRELGRSDG